MYDPLVSAAISRARTGREPLSRERILAAALELADAEGLEALSMRRLAQALGVEAMSLYHYADGKDDILAGIADLVVEQIELPSPEGDWRSAMRASAISAHHVLREHPWACNLLMSANRISPNRLRMIDAMLARLADAHLPGETADLAYHALDSHILGFTLWEAGYSRGLRSMPDDPEEIVRTLGLQAHPHLVDHMHFHLEPPPTVQRKKAFEFGLDLILDGVSAG